MLDLHYYEQAIKSAVSINYVRNIFLQKLRFVVTTFIQGHERFETQSGVHI
jgi:hypothetical protein